MFLQKEQAARKILPEFRKVLPEFRKRFSLNTGTVFPEFRMGVIQIR